MNVDSIIRKLGLQPHPREGGFFVETYRSVDSIPSNILDEHRPGRRSVSTAIYYLLTPDTHSPLHRLRSDELFHFYAGDPVEMLQLHPNGSGRRVVLGPDLLADMQPQVVVPRGVWQGARLRAGGAFALLGCTVAPGFEYEDYEAGDRAALSIAYPAFHGEILALTPAYISA